MQSHIWLCELSRCRHGKRRDTEAERKEYRHDAGCLRPMHLLWESKGYKNILNIANSSGLSSENSGVFGTL